MFTIKLGEETMTTVLMELYASAQSATLKRTPYVVASICTVVATLIANAGRNGGTEQGNLMRLAERVGFTPMYYGDGIRVSYQNGGAQAPTLDAATFAPK